MKQPKPIFVGKLPNSVDNFTMRSMQNELEKQLDDYHVILVRAQNEAPEFEVFYEKDFNEVKYQELKDIISKAIEK